MTAKTSAPDDRAGSKPEADEPDTDEAAVPEAQPRRRPSFTAVAGWVVPILSVVWLVVELWSARVAVHNSAGGDNATRLIHAWYALPSVVQATVTAGFGVGLLVRHRAEQTWKRLALAAPAGTVVGLVVALLVWWAYPHLPSTVSRSVIFIVAGLLGGAVAGAMRAKYVAVAALSGMIIALAVATYLNTARVGNWMLSVYGKGSSGQSEFTAGKLVQYTDFLICGLIAGLIAALLMRRAGCKVARLHALTGAAAGIMLLVAYVLVEIGGRDLLNAANAIDAPTKLMNDLEWDESVPNAMIVLFIGAFVGLISYGRALGKRTAVKQRA